LLAVNRDRSPAAQVHRNHQNTCICDRSLSCPIACDKPVEASEATMSDASRITDEAHACHPCFGMSGKL
jgi:hypothetical protein